MKLKFKFNVGNLLILLSAFLLSASAQNQNVALLLVGAFFGIVGILFE